MLEQQIQEDIKAAMKAKDTVALAATRAIKGEILLFKTSEGGSKEVTDGDILKMIQKLIKQRKESAEQYTAAGRQELADNELAEAAVMEKYLPKQLSAEEVKAKVREIIAQVGATSIKDMGKVMGAANKALAGQSDGRTISAAVKEKSSKAAVPVNLSHPRQHGLASREEVLKGGFKIAGVPRVGHVSSDPGIGHHQVDLSRRIRWNDAL